MNQVYFYHAAFRQLSTTVWGLNPFMNQVYFYLLNWTRRNNKAATRS